MPIVFVHGVTTRMYNPHHVTLWKGIESSLRRYVAPVISTSPDRVAIVPAYWGDLGVNFAWGLNSLPGSVQSQPHQHPLVDLIIRGGVSDAFTDAVRRGGSLPGHVFARSIQEFRKSLNEQMTLFLGDIFGYLANRGTAAAPGPIPLRVLETLHKVRTSHLGAGEEPLVVVSHSMGGQIVYDLVTHFIPKLPEYANIRIDYWASLSSQIGLFAEMRLFLEKNDIYQLGNPIPFPDRRHLGHWWNMWDPNDALSYTVKGIVGDVDDAFFDSGLAIHEAHVGCLEQASLYAMLAQKVRSRSLLTAR
jgi:hypothetical protein